jgi:hypothetical protein
VSGSTHDVIIIGAGHNALVAAFYLAKAGRRPVVLEKQPHVGGGAVTTEIHEGFRCPRFSHEVLLDERIVDDLNLERHGAEFIPLPALVCAPSLMVRPSCCRTTLLPALTAFASSTQRTPTPTLSSVPRSNDWPP